MTKVPITVIGYRCDRCGHEWVPHDFINEPKVCPKCKSPYWNIPKVNLPMTYEYFCERVRMILQSVDHPLTWTEVRTRSGLAQLFPNNQWVRRMENDIGLHREKDEKGIIHWNLNRRGE